MTTPARRFEDLVVWRKAYQFVLAVYELTHVFPKSETYGLASQFRRGAVSIPANIAEGFKRRGNADKVRFMNVAQASLEESRYYLYLARDLNYCDPVDALSQIAEVSKLLDAYTRAINSRDS